MNFIDISDSHKTHIYLYIYIYIYIYMYIHRLQSHSRYKETPIQGADTVSNSLEGSSLQVPFKSTPDIIPPHTEISFNNLMKFFGHLIGRDGKYMIASNIENDCQVSPLIITPMYISIKLLTNGYFSQAAHIYWTSVLRRPLMMFTSHSASSLLNAHIMKESLPFYLSPASEPFLEIQEGSWGWRQWGDLCRLAMNKKEL
jgi:hypothetical protein